jgi:hypothetical protein
MKTFYDWLNESAGGSNLDIVKKAFADGIDKDDSSVLGYHGTSLLSLQSAIDRGYFRVTEGTGILYGGEHSGYSKDFSDYGFHIMPNPDNKIVKGMEFRNPLNTSAITIAGQFASVIRDRHARFQKYGLDLDNPKHHELLYPIENMEKTESEIVRKHKLRSVGPIKSGGVILAISDKVRDEFEVVVGGDGDDLNIKTNALPLRYVVGIEPVDDYSFDVLDSL